ncbi:uncharacterized protein STEHIDRAFT_124691 [Stereum hirsutum FP-91666 SS1]|uniref:uncharacterized protein n=1 Tax=Stereum hirsutum (strain FP-91666) TaxID=721885 RepID=UPI0004449C03|nr:uncharacterized protein STEHIDRAFT_124691 [Stereum hirsutum FP-91666 SS1]EIM81813.1 hypothetical protein STEHIDRAFT_124691 [Stereum hirsutum FP-91666 SS1]
MVYYIVTTVLHIGKQYTHNKRSYENAGLPASRVHLGIAVQSARGRSLAIYNQTNKTTCRVSIFVQSVKNEARLDCPGTWTGGDSVKLTEVALLVANAGFGGVVANPGERGCVAHRHEKDEGRESGEGVE